MTSLPAPERTRTDRLVLSRLVGGDASALYPVMTDGDAAVLRRRMGWAPIQSEATVAAYAADYERRWDEGECAAYLVSLEGEPSPAGAGFIYLDVGDDRIDADRAEIGLWLHPDYWDRGLGAELADGLTRVALDDLGCSGVDAATLPENSRAAKMLGEWADRHGGDDVGLVTGPTGATERRFSV